MRLLTKVGLVAAFNLAAVCTITVAVISGTINLYSARLNADPLEAVSRWVPALVALGVVPTILLTGLLAAVKRPRRVALALSVGAAAALGVVVVLTGQGHPMVLVDLGLIGVLSGSSSGRPVHPPRVRRPEPADRDDRVRRRSLQPGVS